MRLAIFDLDDVLVHEGFEPPIVCKEALASLSYLKDRGVTCVIASYNEAASNLLAEVNLLNYFFAILGEKEDLLDAKRSQLIYYRNLYPDAKLHFFDDLTVNVNTAYSLAIPATLVDYTQGLVLADVQRAFPPIGAAK